MKVYPQRTICDLLFTIFDLSIILTKVCLKILVEYLKKTRQTQEIIRILPANKFVEMRCFKRVLSAVGFKWILRSPIWINKVREINRFWKPRFLREKTQNYFYFGNIFQNRNKTNKKREIRSKIEALGLVCKYPFSSEIFPSQKSLSRKSG